MSQHTRGARSVPVNFLEVTAFCNHRTGVAMHPLNILVGTIPFACRDTSHPNLALHRCRAIRGFAATVAGVSLHCATKMRITDNPHTRLSSHNIISSTLIVKTRKAVTRDIGKNKNILLTVPSFVWLNVSTYFSGMIGFPSQMIRYHPGRLPSVLQMQGPINDSNSIHQWNLSRPSTTTTVHSTSHPKLTQ